jgi:hypothetical protein
VIVGGEMIVYSFSSTRVTGRFYVEPAGSDVAADGTFDVPICNFPASGSASDAGARDICLPPMASAPTNAVSAPCTGLPATTAGGTLSGVTGSRSGPSGSFPSSTFDTGFASIESVTDYPSSSFSTLYLQFADYESSCGYEATGSAKADGHLFAVWAFLSGTTAAPASFAAGTYTDVFSDSYPEVNTAATDKECVGAVPPSVHGTSDTVTISAIDSAHVVGSFQLEAAEDAGAVSGTFDLPLCNPPAYSGGAPQTCCL